LQPILNKKVDVVISGHVHTYERTYPVSGLEREENKNKNPRVFTNPKYPVYLVCGATGNNEYIVKVGQDYYIDEEDEDEVAYLFAKKNLGGPGVCQFEVTNNQLKMKYIHTKSERIKDRFTINKILQ